MESTIKIVFLVEGKTIRREAWGTLDGQKPTIDDHLVEMIKQHGNPTWVYITISRGLPKIINPDQVRTLT